VEDKKEQKSKKWDNDNNMLLFALFMFVVSMLLDSTPMAIFAASLIYNAESKP